MHKIAAFFLFLTSFSLQAMFDFPPQLGKKTEFKINEPFSIGSKISKPYPAPEDFQWKDEDEWQLVSYPRDAIILINTYGTAPDGDGGRLSQRFTLKARKAGKFELVFKRPGQQVVVPVIILKQIHKPQWVTVEKSYWGNKKIDLGWGEQNFVLEKGDVVTIKAPELNAIYDNVEDSWKLSSNKKLEIMREDNYPDPSFLFQSWEVKFEKSGIYELAFRTSSKELVIQIHVRD